MGLKGGGRGWCSDCLKAEEHEKIGLFKDGHGNLFFTCQSCFQKVGFRKENKKDKGRKGTEHLYKKHLCQVCFDLTNTDIIQDK